MRAIVYLRFPSRSYDPRDEKPVMVPVEGVSVGVKGLYLCPEMKWDRKAGTYVADVGYTLTHEDSGLVAVRAKTKAALLRVLPFLRPFDWQVDEDEIRKSEEMQKAGADANSLLRYADFRYKGHEDLFFAELVRLTGSEMGALAFNERGK